MHPDITNSWIPGKNEMHFLLPTFRRVIFRLCLLSMEGSALWQCTDTERLSTPVFLIIPFGVYAVSLFFHSLLLASWLTLDLRDVASARWNFFPSYGSLSFFFLFFSILFLPCDWMHHALFFLLATLSFWIPALSMCTIASLIHRLTGNGLSASTDYKCCHIVCCIVVPDEATPNVF